MSDCQVLLCLAFVSCVVNKHQFNFYFIFRRKYAKTNRKEKKTSRTGLWTCVNIFHTAIWNILVSSGNYHSYHCFSGTTIERNTNDRNSTYSDIRESKIVNSGDDTSFHYTLPRQCYKTEFENLSCKNKLQKTLPALKRFRFFQQKSAQNCTESEVAYDFCSEEKNTIPYTQLIFKKAIQNTRENDTEHA